MEPYPYQALHLASSLEADRNEAEDDARTYPIEGRMRSVRTVQELYNLFSALMAQSARLDYLDFHCHGFPGSLSLGSEDLDFSKLQKFRAGGFSVLFNSGAFINFFSCDMGGENIRVDDSEDGELFLSEFAHIFLNRNGGEAMGWTAPWHYRWNPILGSSFTNAGTSVQAIVAAGASRAVLKGHHRLDEQRINTELTILRTFVSAALNSLPTPQAPQSHLQDPLPGSVQKMLLDAAAKLHSDQVAKFQGVYRNCLQLLDKSLVELRAPASSYYLNLHRICSTINVVAATITGLGIPLGQLMQPVFTALLYSRRFAGDG